MDLINLKKDLNYIASNLKIDLFSKEQIIEELGVKFINSINKNIQNKSKVGIAFSGGVDSSLIAFLCKKYKKNFKLYTVGIGEREDSIWAKKIAHYLKLPISIKNIDFDEAYDIIKKVTNILKEDHPVKVGIGSTLYSVFSLIKNDNIDTVVTGLGSDTLFLGFEKYRKALEKDNLMKEYLHGLKNIYKNDVKRDLLIAKLFNLNLICPYLDKEFIEYCVRIDPKLKVNNEEKKIILRETAINLGLKKEFSNRKKLAAQYGSGFDKAIAIFAKENGFKYKRDFLNSLLEK